MIIDFKEIKKYTYLTLDKNDMEIIKRLDKLVTDIIQVNDGDYAENLSLLFELILEKDFNREQTQTIVNLAVMYE